jgi:hypothetical protein
MREVDQQLLSRALGAVRRSVPSSAWDRYAEAIAIDRRAGEQYLDKPAHEIDRSLFERLDEFRARGLLQLPVALSADLVEILRAHLETQPVHVGPHTLDCGRRQMPLAEARRHGQMAGYTMGQLLRTPAVIDVFNRPDIVDFVQQYLGCVPTLYSINGWWSFPATAPESMNVQYFHRDTDDWRFCTLFLYVTHVDALAGPHQVVAGSHTMSGMRRLLDRARAAGREIAEFDAAGSFIHTTGSLLSADTERLLADDIQTVTGPPGTMFLVNTLALHRGLVPSSTPRLMLWARYGLGPNTNSADLEQGPLCRAQLATALPDTPRNRYINRLLFEFDRGPWIPA